MAPSAALSWANEPDTPGGGRRARRAARLDQLPAGGLVGAVAGIILVLFLVLVITDLLGVTDVFAFIDPLPRGQARSP